MIAKEHRFRGQNDIRRVYRRGKTVRGPIMSMKYLPNRQQGRYRLAVVVSKKVHKSAVKRNRIRRRIYEAVRRRQECLEPLDIVITVFHDTVAFMPAAELESMVHAQLSQAGALSAKPSRAQ